MIVLAFHGQGANGQRLRADMGDPPWCHGYPNWQDHWEDAKHFSDYWMDHRLGRCVLVGYSLGGDFIARLTYQAMSRYIGGIVTYEAPLLTRSRPNALPCPAMVIWNDYIPRSEARRQKKADSIAGWNQQYRQVSNIVGRHRSHVLLSWRPPFMRHAWDRSLNGLIGKWIANLDSPPVARSPAR